MIDCAIMMMISSDSSRGLVAGGGGGGGGGRRRRRRRRRRRKRRSDRNLSNDSSSIFIRSIMVHRNFHRSKSWLTSFAPSSGHVITCGSGAWALRRDWWPLGDQHCDHGTSRRWREGYGCCHNRQHPSETARNIRLAVKSVQYGSPGLRLINIHRHFIIN